MESFGRYQLQEKLGQGGMGVVYRAFDTVLERVVALKLVLTPEGLDPDMRQRFMREARAAGQLSHKNIVTVYDLGEHGGNPYLAMEFLDGEDLQKRLARPEKMSLRRKLDLAIEICEGVEFAHAHGVIHRDLKPANIFITESGGAKILDFGLARLITSQLTHSNMLMGTLNYMAPEQVRGERADQRSDVFSIGVVLYELFGGRKAFEGDSVASTLYKILQEVPEPLHKIDAALPIAITSAIDRALAKLRDERYASADELRKDLDAYRHVLLAQGPVTPVPSRQWSRPGMEASARQAPRRPGGVVAALAAAAAVLAIVLAGVWLAKSRPQREPATPAPPAVATQPETPVAAPPPSVPAQPAPAPVAPPSRATAAPETDAARRRTIEARGSTESARARGRAATPAAAAPQPAPSPVSEPAAGVPPGAAAPPPAAAPVTTSPAPPPPTAVTPAPSAPAAPEPVAPAASSAPVTQGPPAEERITELLGHYKDALEARSLDQLKRWWPSLSGSAEAAIRQEFQHASRITVAMDDIHIAVNGDAATVTFLRRYSLVTVEGQRLQRTTRATMEVRRAAAGWVIGALRFSPS